MQNDAENGRSEIGCPMCQTWRNRGKTYCGDCGKFLGYSIPAEPGKKGQGIFDPVMTGCTVLFIITAVAALAVGIFGMGHILNDINSLSLPVYIPGGLEDLVLFRITGTALDAYYVMVIVILTVCIFYTLYKTVTACRERSGSIVQNLPYTDMGACTALICVTLAISVIYFVVTAVTTGETADSSWMDTYTKWQMSFLLINAGFQEEVAFRLILIGIPITAISLLATKKANRWKLLLGGFGMNKAAFILILVSSVLFGLAHYEGWGAVKIAQTLVAGFIFGYAYVQYGLRVSIIMHFVNDTASLFVGGSLILSVLMFIGIFVLIYFIINRNRSVYDFKGMPLLPDIPEKKNE